MHLGWFCLFAKYYHGKGHTVCLVPYIYCATAYVTHTQARTDCCGIEFKTLIERQKGRKRERQTKSVRAIAGARVRTRTRWGEKSNSTVCKEEIEWNIIWLSHRPWVKSEIAQHTENIDSIAHRFFFTTFSTYFLHMYIVRQTEMKPFAKPKYSQTIRRTT